MNCQKLIIYDYVELFSILDELKNELNLDITKISRNNLSNLLLKNNENNLIVTQKKIPEIDDQIIVNDLPVKISKLVEKFNIVFLKKSLANNQKLKLVIIKLI